MIKNGVYNLLGGAVRLCLSLATIPILISILGLKQYGLYALVNAIISFAVLSEWSISTSLTVFLASSNKSDYYDKLENDNNQILKSSSIVVLLLGSITALGLYLLVPLLPYFFRELEQSEIYLFIECCQLSVFLIWVRIIQQFFIGIEQAYESYGALNIINTGYLILFSVVTLVTAFVSRSLVIIFYCQFIITILCMFAHALFCYRKGFISLRFWRSKINYSQTVDIMRYSVKAWFGSFGSVLFSQGDRLVVGNLLGSEIVGIYAAMTSITSQINNISAMPLQTIVPQLSQAYDLISVETTKIFNSKKIIAAYKFNLFLSLLLGGGVIGFAPEALMLLSIKKSQESSFLMMYKYFIVLGIIYTIYSLNALGYYVLLALRETSIFLWTQLLSGGVTLLAIIWLTNNYGLSGAILGNSLYLLVFCFTWFAAQKLSISIKSFIKASLFPMCVFSAFIVVAVLCETLMVRIIWTTLFSAYTSWSLVRAVQAYQADLSFHN